MKKRFFSVLGIVSITMITLISCNVKEEVQNKQNEQVKKEIDLDYGACIYEDSNGYSILDFENNSYKEIESDSVILNFNKASGAFLYIKDLKYYVHTKDGELEIEDKDVQAPAFSQNGEYLFYFIKDNNLQPIIYDVKNKQKIDLKIKCSISGTYATWLGDDKLAYYGVDIANKTSGIFTYNLKSNNERLEYEIAGGYISFIKPFKDTLIFFVEKYDGSKELKSLSKDGDIVDIADNISEIFDLQMINNEIYVLGRMIDNVYSLYEISNNKRLIFDFPSVINFDKGLSSSENGEVIFAGNNTSDNNEKIYAYSEDSVYMVNSKSGNYTFITIN